MQFSAIPLIALNCIASFNGVASYERESVPLVATEPQRPFAELSVNNGYRLRDLVAFPAC